MTTVTGKAAAALSSITLSDGLAVTRIGYGAMQLTGPQVWGEYGDPDGAVSLLRHIVDAGVNLIDTADVYGPHSNELLIHDALHPYPDHLVIATKGGYVRGSFDYSTLDSVGNRNYLRQSARMSARRVASRRSTSTTCTADKPPTRRSRTRLAPSPNFENKASFVTSGCPT